MKKKRKIVIGIHYTREYIENPYNSANLTQRLIQSETVFYEDGCVFEDLGNGYIRIDKAPIKN